MPITSPALDPAEPPSRRRPWFWGLIIGMPILLLAALSAWTGSLEAPSPPPAAAQPPRVVGAETGVIAAAWVDPAEIQQGGEFRLWLSLENRSGATALGLRFLSFAMPGFRQAGLCWEGGGPACVPQGPGRHPILRPPSRIEKGGALLLFGLVEPTGESRLFGATGAFSWHDDMGGTFQGAILLPPVPISSPTERFWLGVGRFLLFLKDLLIPAAIACFAWFLKDLDDTRQRAERRREQRQEDSARQQARLDDTWKLMLPKSHAYAEQHYMPVLSAADDFVSEVAGIKPNAPEEEWQRLLWRFLRLRRRMIHMGQTIGGLFFRNLQGEVLAAACWNQFGDAASQALDTVKQDQILVFVTSDETFAEFLEKLTDPSSCPPATREALNRLVPAFRLWSKSGILQRNLPLLKIFAYILDYEANRPYELWYGKPTPLLEHDFAAALRQLEPIHHALKVEVETYLEEEKQRLAKISTLPSD
jgi:hypothetical protein